MSHTDSAPTSATSGHGWRALGWLVVAGWTVALVALAVWAYRRDKSRA
jgi:hypothetical protein